MTISNTLTVRSARFLTAPAIRWTRLFMTAHSYAVTFHCILINTWLNQARTTLLITQDKRTRHFHLQQTPRWSWEGSGWVWALCPGLCVCFQVSAAAAACEPQPPPNAPQLRTNAPPSPQEYPSQAQPPMYLKEGDIKINGLLRNTLKQIAFKRNSKIEGESVFTQVYVCKALSSKSVSSVFINVF